VIAETSNSFVLDNRIQKNSQITEFKSRAGRTQNVVARMSSRLLRERQLHDNVGEGSFREQNQKELQAIKELFCKRQALNCSKTKILLDLLIHSAKQLRYRPVLKPEQDTD
jgi:hypothetical protein